MSCKCVRNPDGLIHGDVKVDGEEFGETEFCFALMGLATEQISRWIDSSTRVPSPLEPTLSRIAMVSLGAARSAELRSRRITSNSGVVPSFQCDVARVTTAP